MTDKVCFISLTNLYLCPYLKKYISIIGSKTAFDIVYWNRHDITEYYNEDRQYAYSYNIGENVSKLRKVKGYLGFSRFAQRVIEKEKLRLILYIEIYQVGTLFRLSNF